MKYLIPFLFLLASCGGAYTVAVSGQVDVVASLDPTSIVAAFTAACQQQLGPTATSAQISQCAQVDVGNLINGLSNLMNNQ